MKVFLFRSASGDNKKTSLKRQLGGWLIPRLPISRHVFDHLRLEINAAWVRTLNFSHPNYRRIASRIRERKNLLANVGCGPFGLPGWINLDLFWFPNITLRSDCRRRFPFSNGSCVGMHVEHFFEHLSHDDERKQFLAECLRCLAPGGVLRIVVPNAELYIESYLANGWERLNAVTCGGDVPQRVFRTKMEALNHVFLQGSEHHGGYDAETLEIVLSDAGFRNISRRAWREGSFPGGCIDREQHRPYSLYVEATR